MAYKKRFWAAVFTLAGSVIGAGILGLPFVFSRSGFFVGLFWLIFLGLIMVYVNLSLGEITLRTRKMHHIPGYAEKYLGKLGGRIMLLAMLFGIYSALLAYLIGEGQSLAKIFGVGLEYAIYFGIGFWIVMTLLLREGLKGLKKIETWGVIGILIIISVIFLWLVPGVSFENINYVSFNFDDFVLPFGVTLFALLGFSAIPELRQEIDGKEKLLKKAILIGMLIPIIVYILFSFVFVGVLGQSVSEVATVSFDGFLGFLLVLLGIFTMLTSYFVLSFAIKDIFIYDLNYGKKSFFYIAVIPLILYLLVWIFGFAGFVKILGIGGVVSGGVTGILILLMNYNAKKKGDRKSEFSLIINKGIIIVLSLIFILGIIFELFF